MTNKILDLIDIRNYPDAYELANLHGTLPKIYNVWTQIFDGQKFENIDRSIKFNDIEIEIIESIKLYIHLSKSNWDKELLSEFRKVAKMIIAETSSELRNASRTNINGQIIQHNDFYINPEIRNYLQELIEHFDKKELHESKADLARVKAQITLSMNLKKHFVGSDMIQYGKFYENVKQYEESTQIYYGIIHDFEQASNISYDDKKEQLLELDLLKQAYEGVFRLTKSTDIPQKLNKLNLVISKLQNQTEIKQPIIETTYNHSNREKSWFNKVFGE